MKGGKDDNTVNVVNQVNENELTQQQPLQQHKKKKKYSPFDRRQHRYIQNKQHLTNAFLNPRQMELLYNRFI